MTGMIVHDLKNPLNSILGSENIEQQTLLSIVPQIKQLDVYEVCEMRKLLKTIDFEQSQNLKHWHETMMNALRSGNEEVFAQLIFSVES